MICPHCEKPINITIEPVVDLTKEYKIMIDSKPYKIHFENITGAKIKVLSSIPKNYGVWLKVESPEDDVEIDDNEKVLLNETSYTKLYTGIRHITMGAGR